ncbi:RNA polymerase sigma factor [Amycolatopsis sp. WQ 127309]|uniref:RNA polymerase sigma factor n=1 Tax=Amycolatopsis sp. WQ 127309 TaxID=2932773 RepID=UPI001FF51A64|nr:RNA polymerase sigma factor [Amycolatopsis sp. WQ 127309]UOZ09843.1 RNA polymerase sigma factor [Amycolatopsis sp. WQ 127309]
MSSHLGVPVDQAGDRELWDRAAGGDEGAFGELFERHAEAVWNHAYRLTGSWSGAEDLTSTTFLTAWRRRADVTLVRDSALPWLYTVAGNAARDEYRGAKRRLRLLRRIPDPPVVSDHADAVAEQLDGEQRLLRVVEAVRTLPKAQREVVELCLLGDLSTGDAAALLAVAEGTVRSHLSRARARLRALLEEK